MRVLIVTKIFPNALEPAFAPFNRQHFAALSNLCDVEVLALIPWFPGASLLSRWLPSGRRAHVPTHEFIDGLSVVHPRVLYIPKLGQPVAGFTYAASLLPYALKRRGCVDIILGSFAYPDGFASIALSRLLNVPTVIKVHGTDLNILSKSALIRPNLRFAMSHAAAVVGTSQALVDVAIGLGANPIRSRVIMNGIDRELFFVRDRDACRRQLSISNAGKIVLFLGRIEKEKGAFDLLHAFDRLRASIPELSLVMVGDGSSRFACEKFAKENALPVTFAGARPHSEIPLWLGACDVMALPSWAEGTPNVVLEALVSGRPVVASRVGGIPAVMSNPHFGEMVDARSPSQLAAALASVLDQPYDCSSLANEVKVGGWDDSARVLFDVLKQAVRDFRS
jgi:glycosyltransferase involved in cell wall biosynthesis